MILFYYFNIYYVSIHMIYYGLLLPIVLLVPSPSRIIFFHTPIGDLSHPCSFLTCSRASHMRKKTYTFLLETGLFQGT